MGILIPNNFKHPVNGEILNPQKKDKVYLRKKQIRKLLAILLVLSCWISISGCEKSYPGTIEENKLVDVAEITEYADNFKGKSVLVRNDVLEKIGARGFILDKDQVFRGENILVIGLSETPVTLSPDDTPEILAKGTVENFSLEEIETKYGLTLEANLYEQYANKPVILAESIILSPDPGDLNKHSEFYTNQPLAIKGEIEEVKKHGLFIIDEEQVFGKEDLVVLQTNPEIKFKEEDIVIAYGFLRPLIAAELVQAYNLNWNSSTQEKIEAEYSQKYILVADKIQLVELDID